MILVKQTDVEEPNDIKGKNIQFIVFNEQSFDNKVSSIKKKVDEKKSYIIINETKYFHKRK